MSFLPGFFLLAALFPLESIQVEGLKRLKPAQIIAASGLKIGQKVDKPDFEAAQARLVATGVLASVGFRYASSASGNGYTLTFEVAELAQIFPVKFEDIDRPEAELLKVLAAADPMFTNPVPGSDPVIKRLEAALNAHLKAEPKIVGKIVMDRPDQAVVLFRPNRPRATVSSVTFSGTKAFSTAELQVKMATVAIGVLYTEENFRELLNNQIRPIYETVGLLRVTFPKITAKRSEDNEGVDVAVEVVEGDEYKLNRVTMSGAPRDTALLKDAGFKEGQTFRLGEVVESLEKLRASFRAQGYMKVTTDSTRTYDDAKKTVNMNVAVTYGTQYKMGRLTIKGLDVTTEPEIRKMWGMREGNPFRDQYPEKFLTRVREDGVMDNLGETRASLNYDEPRGIINVTLTFEAEKKEPQKKRPF